MIDRERAIALATQFVQTPTLRLVESFQSLPFSEIPRNIKFEAVRRIDGQWAVVFEWQQDTDGCDSPGATIINVFDDGRCEFFQTL